MCIPVRQGRKAWRARLLRLVTFRILTQLRSLQALLLQEEHLLGLHVARQCGQTK